MTTKSGCEQYTYARGRPDALESAIVVMVQRGAEMLKRSSGALECVFAPKVKAVRDRLM